MLKSKLSGGNVINAINIWAAAMVLYGAEIINWNKGDFDRFDQKKQKLLNMHRV